MPELPEVEICRRGLNAAIGRPIVSVESSGQRLRCPVPENLQQILLHRQFSAIGRRGKYLLLAVSTNAGQRVGTLISHLGMSGQWRLSVPPNITTVSTTTADTDDSTRKSDAKKHEHLRLGFADGGSMAYRDPRRFGLCVWQAGGDEEALAHPLLASLGAEPLADNFSAQDWWQRIHTRRTALKTVLMDSHIVVGVGNIYAAESLFLARLSPFRAANRLRFSECERLWAAIRHTLNAALAAGGSSIRDYVHSDGEQGWFQLQVAVYGRAGSPCTVCHEPILVTKQNARSTFFCPHCQGVSKAEMQALANQPGTKSKSGAAH